MSVSLILPDFSDREFSPGDSPEVEIAYKNENDDTREVQLVAIQVAWENELIGEEVDQVVEPDTKTSFTPINIKIPSYLVGSPRIRCGVKLQDNESTSGNTPEWEWTEQDYRIELDSNSPRYEAVVCAKKGDVSKITKALHNYGISVEPVHTPDSLKESIEGTDGPILFIGLISSGETTGETNLLGEGLNAIEETETTILETILLTQKEQEPHGYGRQFNIHLEYNNYSLDEIEWNLGPVVSTIRMLENRNILSELLEYRRDIENICDIPGETIDNIDISSNIVDFLKRGAEREIWSILKWLGLTAGGIIVSKVVKEEIQDTDDIIELVSDFAAENSQRIHIPGYKLVIQSREDPEIIFEAEKTSSSEIVSRLATNITAADEITRLQALESIIYLSDHDPEVLLDNTDTPEGDLPALVADALQSGTYLEQFYAAKILTNLSMDLPGQIGRACTSDGKKLPHLLINILKNGSSEDVSDNIPDNEVFYQDDSFNSEINLLTEVSHALGNLANHDTNLLLSHRWYTIEEIISILSNRLKYEPYWTQNNTAWILNILASDYSEEIISVDSTRGPKPVKYVFDIISREVDNHESEKLLMNSVFTLKTLLNESTEAVLEAGKTTEERAVRSVTNGKLFPVRQEMSSNHLPYFERPTYLETIMKLCTAESESQREQGYLILGKLANHRHEVLLAIHGTDKKSPLSVLIEGINSDSTNVCIDSSFALIELFGAEKHHIVEDYDVELENIFRKLSESLKNNPSDEELTSNHANLIAKIWQYRSTDDSEVYDDVVGSLGDAIQNTSGHGKDRLIRTLATIVRRTPYVVASEDQFDEKNYSSRKEEEVPFEIISHSSYRRTHFGQKTTDGTSLSTLLIQELCPGDGQNNLNHKILDIFGSISKYFPELTAGVRDDSDTQLECILLSFFGNKEISSRNREKIAKILSNMGQLSEYNAFNQKDTKGNTALELMVDMLNNGETERELAESFAFRIGQKSGSEELEELFAQSKSLMNWLSRDDQVRIRLLVHILTGWASSNPNDLIEWDTSNFHQTFRIVIDILKQEAKKNNSPIISNIVKIIKNTSEADSDTIGAVQNKRRETIPSVLLSNFHEFTDDEKEMVLEILENIFDTAPQTLERRGYGNKTVFANLSDESTDSDVKDILGKIYSNYEDGNIANMRIFSLILGDLASINRETVYEYRNITSKLKRLYQDSDDKTVQNAAEYALSKLGIDPDDIDEGYHGPESVKQHSGGKAVSGKQTGKTQYNSETGGTLARLAIPAAILGGSAAASRNISGKDAVTGVFWILSGVAFLRYFIFDPHLNLIIGGTILFILGLYILRS